jgi:CMP-N,N'-diacetyllegionaminic acid synthase
MKIKALIAVRSGSVRVPSKNVRAFAHTTLLDIKIRQLLRVKELDGIVVNSNSPEILERCSQYDVEQVLRGDYFASNEVYMSEVYTDMAQNFSGDVVVYANVTNPLLEDETISSMVNKFRDLGDEFDSVNSTHLIKEFMFLDGKPINYDLQHQPRSQDLPDIHAINFAISAISKADMISLGNVVGTKPFLWKIGETESLDIDSMLDFQVAEHLYRLKQDEAAKR